MWKTITGNLYKGVQIQIWCNIAAAVFALIGVLTIAGDIASGDLFGALVWDTWDTLGLIANLGAIYGFWVFFSNLKPWQAIVAQEDAKAVGNIYTATLLQMIAIVLTYIPFVGLVAGILNIIAWVMLLIAYSNLKNSATFPAKEGAGKIFTAMILSVVGAIIAWIPIIGLIGSFLAIVALVMTLNGWKAIANAEA